MLSPPVEPSRFYTVIAMLFVLLGLRILFGIGKLLLGSTGVGLVFLAISAASGYAIYWDFSRRGWEVLSGRESGAQRRE